MATVPSKHHQPLHNFSLPFLKWGQRIQSSNHCRRRYRNSPPTESDLNNRTNPNRSSGTVIKNEIDDENGKLIDAVSDANGDVRPWNLRPRRFVIDTVDGNGAVAAAKEEKDEDRRTKKRRLWISLSKEEIEEDIYAFTGSRPSRRPKKRNKIAQKQVDNVFPGLYLVGISADTYRV